MRGNIVSICVPTLERPQQLSRLLNRIPLTAEWSYEVIAEYDSFEDRRGCPKTLARAVERAQYPYVAFLGNDCLPQAGWLRIAMERMAEFPDCVGLCGFNDLGWTDGRCLHWVASKGLLPMLDGEFFCTKYKHVGCDDELVARCRQAGRYAWCPEAVVAHYHFTSGAEFDRVYQAGWNLESVEHDRALLRERAERMGFAHWLPA